MSSPPVLEMKTLRSKCRRMLSSGQWAEFGAKTSIGDAVQFLSQILNITDNDLKLNPFLKQYEAVSDWQNTKLKLQVLNNDPSVSLKQLDSLYRELTRLIGLDSQISADKKSRPGLCRLYWCRSLTALRKHELIWKVRRRHEKTAFLSSVIDWKTAIRLKAVEKFDNNYRLSKLMATAKKRCDKSNCGYQLPVKLVMQRLDSRMSPDSGICSGIDLSPTSEPPAPKLEVKKCSTKGRFIRTDQDLREGDEVMTEMPFVYTLSPEFHSSRCINCLDRITDRFTKCPRKCPVVFCSSYCYNSMSSLHSYECSQLFLILGETSHFQLTVRFFLRSLEPSTPEHESASDLAQHFTRYTDDDRFDAAIKSLYISFVLSRMKVLDLEKDINEGCPLMSRVLKQLCQIQTNSVSLADGTGSAIFNRFSLICHSCDPNLKCRYQGKRLCLTANKDISRGSELTITYSSERDVNERRKKLKYAYLFDCYCNKCLKEINQNLTVEHVKPKTKCVTCDSDLKPATDSSDVVRFVCNKNSCSEEVINFEVKLSFIRDYLTANSRPFIASDNDVLSSLHKRYVSLITFFLQPNLLQLGFEILFSKLYFHRNEFNGSAVWCQTAFLTSYQLFGCHWKTSVCFFRLVFLEAEKNSAKIDHVIQSMSQKYVIPSDDVQFFSNECLSKNNDLQSLMSW